jgi:hypothetical protein
VGGLIQGLEDPNFPSITYRRGASEERSIQEIAEDYDLTESQVQKALDFCQAHRKVKQETPAPMNFFIRNRGFSTQSYALRSRRAAVW